MIHPYTQSLAHLSIYCAIILYYYLTNVAECSLTCLGSLHWIFNQYIQISLNIKSDKYNVISI